MYRGRLARYEGIGELPLMADPSRKRRGEVLREDGGGGADDVAVSPAAQAPPAPVIPPMTSRAKPEFATDAIPGFEAVDMDDRPAVLDLMTRVLVIKCPDENYDSKVYDRPTDWRVEIDRRTYTLRLIGWHQPIDHTLLVRIMAMDQKEGDARNLVSVAVGESLYTNDPSRVGLSVIMVYKREALRRRDVATAASDTGAAASSPADVARAMIRATEPAASPMATRGRLRSALAFIMGDQ